MPSSTQEHKNNSHRQKLDDRLFHERRWADMCAEEALLPEHYAEWLSLRSTHRFLAFKGKELVIWEETDDGVVVKEVLEVCSVHASMDAGLSITVKGDNGVEFTVGHEPVPVDKGIYLWLPFYSDFQYVYRKDLDEFCVYFPMMFRMAFNPKLRKKGALHISEMRTFEELWPEYDWEA